MPSPAQVLVDLTDKMTALLTATDDPADQAQHDAEVAQLKLDLVKAKEDWQQKGSGWLRKGRLSTPKPS